MSDSFFKIRNKKTTVFLICLGISAFLWLLIKLSAEYETMVEIPIKYSDFPSGQSLINSPDTMIIIRIRDNGFDLLGTSLFGFSKAMEMSISNMKSTKTSRLSSKYFMLTKDLYERIQEEFIAAKFISILEPDSLVLDFEQQASKKLKIYAQSQIQLSPQFQLKQAELLSPDSTTIYGSYDDLKRIDSIFTEKISFRDLSSPISTELKLLIPKHLKSEYYTTLYQLEVEKFTEAVINVPIDKSFAKDQNIRIFPNHVQIKYAVSFEKFNEINPDSFHIIATEDPTEIGKLIFILQDHPKGIRIIDYSPKMGEFIILK